MSGTFLGQADPPLIENALLEVSPALSALLAQVVYVSPLRRARETAAAMECTELVVLPELGEIAFGDWTGKTWGEIEEEWPVEAAHKLEDWTGVTPPGGEAWPDFVARVQRGWNLIRQGPSPAAVVAHQAVNCVLANLVAAVPLFSFTQSYGEITELTYVVP